MGAPSAPGTPFESTERVRIEGVDEPLPPGEALLWQGKPDMKTLALRVFYLRAILLYWGAAAVLLLATGRGPGGLAADLTWLVVVAILGTGLIFGLAETFRRTTTYALTNRRVVLRIGAALPAVLNLPLERIDRVDFRDLGRGTGDVVLTPAGDDRIGWLFLWPHVKPWQARDPLPALRGIPDAAEVGRKIAAAVAEARANTSEDEDPDAQ